MLVSWRAAIFMGSFTPCSFPTLLCLWLKALGHFAAREQHRTRCSGAGRGGTGMSCWYLVNGLFQPYIRRSILSSKW